MSLVSVAEVRALVETTLGDVDLQDVIDREEDSVARRIGPLSGPRTITIPFPDRLTAFHLPRPAKDVTLTESGVSSTFRVLSDGGIERTTGYWYGPVAVTFTPIDTIEVKRVVIELVRIVVTDTGYASESAGPFSYSRGGTTAEMRAALIRGLRPKASIGVLRLGRA